MIEFASPEELASWRSNPVTLAYEKFCRERIETYRKDIPEMLLKGETAKAASTAAALKAHEEMVGDLFEPAAPPAEEADDFHDPAERPSLKEK